jgi:hypothetical protein
MLRINVLSLMCVVVCLIMPGVAGAKAGAAAKGTDVGDAGSAVVLEEGLAVYPRPLQTGTAMMHLRKGDAVLTNLEIQGSDGEAWCSIVGGADAIVTGYVKCDGLKMSKPQAPEMWRELPEPSSPGPEARGVPSLPPAALPPPQSGKSSLPRGGTTAPPSPSRLPAAP